MRTKSKVMTSLSAIAVCMLLTASCNYETEGAAGADDALGRYTYNTLNWSDDFTGTSLDTSKWVVETGIMGLAAEEQYYRPASNGNITVSGGILTLTAKRQSYGGKAFTSGRIRTVSTFTTGRIEARIKLPYGQGAFPAFWELTKNWQTSGKYGETDILELWGSESGTENATIESSLHRNSSGSGSVTQAYTTPDYSWFNDDYHIFTVEKTSTQIKFYVDGSLYWTVNQSGTGWTNLTTEPAWIILNLAIIYSDSTTPMPMTMQIDYVKYYK